MRPAVSIDGTRVNLWQKKNQKKKIINCNCHGCKQLFSYCIWVWLLNFPFFHSSSKFYQLRCVHFPWARFGGRKRTLRIRLCNSVSLGFYLIHARPPSERTQKEKTRRAEKTNILHVQSNVHHIFKHISKSSDSEIISQNKYIFFFFFSSTHYSLSRLYNICIYE